MTKRQTARSDGFLTKANPVRLSVLMFMLLCTIATPPVSSFSVCPTTFQTSGKEATKRASSPTSSSLSSSLSSTAATIATTTNTYSREDALHWLDTVLLPQKDYGERIGSGRDAQGVSNQAVNADDPRLTLTYGEFPTHSMDALLDCALERYSRNQNNNDNPNQKPFHMIDLGSGCGRLVLYAALSRPSWTVSGIEISDILHRQAQDAVNRGIQHGLFQTSTVPAETDSTRSSTSGVASGLETQQQQQQQQHASPSSDSSSAPLRLLLGPADAFPHVLSDADIIFAYSTVWATSGFSPELGAMVMDRYWSELLAQSCRKGCIVVTTDRALDPRDGWILLDRMDVDNREVFGSTGFIQVLS